MSAVKTLDWRPLDDQARQGRSVLLRRGKDMALGFWSGEAFVYPASSGRTIEFEPTDYYDPSWRMAGIHA